MRRGVKQHSYYIGDSVLERLPWPQFMRRERRIHRYADPAVAAIAGLLLMRVAPLFGFWFAFAGLSLRFFEDAVYRKEREREMDIVDAVIESEVQVEILERYTVTIDPPPGGYGQPQQGIPTGDGSDIQETILRRKIRRSKPRS